MSSERIDSRFSFRDAFHNLYSDSCRGPLFVLFVFLLTWDYEHKVDQSRLSPLVPIIVRSWLLRFDRDPGFSRCPCQNLRLDGP